MTIWIIACFLRLRPIIDVAMVRRGVILFASALGALFVLTASSCTFKIMQDGGTEGGPEGPGAPAKKAAVAQEPDAGVLQSGVIGPGDLLQITVYGEKELSGTYQVSPEGFIVFPFIGELTIKGMTNFSLAERIAERLREGFIRDPQVSVFVKEFNSRRVFVLGQVKNAGKIPIIHRLSVVEAVALAGGFTNMADINNVVVTRRDESGQEVRFTVDIEAMLSGKAETFYLLPDDIVFVRERFF